MTMTVAKMRHVRARIRELHYVDREKWALAGCRRTVHELEGGASFDGGGEARCGTGWGTSERREAQLSSALRPRGVVFSGTQDAASVYATTPRWLLYCVSCIASHAPTDVIHFDSPGGSESGRAMGSKVAQASREAGFRTWGAFLAAVSFSGTQEARRRTRHSLAGLSVLRLRMQVLLKEQARLLESIATSGCTASPPLRAIATVSLYGNNLPKRGAEEEVICFHYSVWKLCKLGSCKEHGAVKWSTDPSQTAGTYLRNLLPDQGRVFRQLQARTETVRKHIGGSARNLLPEQGEVFRQLRPVLRQVRSTETVRKHIGGSARNVLLEQGGVFKQLQVRSTETIRKHIGGSARNVLPEQGKVFRQLRPVSRQVRSTETVRKHIGGSAWNLLPEQGGVFKQLNSIARNCFDRLLGIISVMRGGAGYFQKP
ncbi:hypothetical protein B0H13DRAFT_2474006 [Mycena leptocephala]|nr:hypothetical protein B0H13DRAFT_2474006 [Mycena leptocephala]